MGKTVRISAQLPVSFEAEELTDLLLRPASGFELGSAETGDSVEQLRSDLHLAVDITLFVFSALQGAASLVELVARIRERHSRKSTEPPVIVQLIVDGTSYDLLAMKQRSIEKTLEDH